ncbi:MAG: hypothetical protein AMXMBFR64_11780 [Myxococcales bacterium]
MPFERLHKLVTYALVCTGLATVLLSGELPAFAWVVAVVGVAASWFARPAARTPLLWNVVLVGIFALLVLVSLSSGNWLVNAVVFAIVMVVSKLFQRRRSRDYYQLYTLSLLLIIAGAVVNPALSFAVAFLGYVVLLTWGLILLHLRRDLEERSDALAAMGHEAADAAWRVRQVVTGRFLAGTSLLAVLIFISSSVIFFIFPRIGFGFFMNQGRRGQQVAGFSSRVELGNFGRIKDNPKVVMRVEVPGGGPGQPPRLRGISFDHYDGRVWSRQVTQRTQDELPAGRHDERRVTVNGVVEEPARSVVYDIWLEPLDMDINAIFGEPRLRAIVVDQSFIQTLQGRSRQFYQDDPSGDVTFTGPRDSTLKYRALSDVPAKEPPGVRLTGTDYPAMIRVAYLQLPALRPEVAALAREVTAEAATPFDKARAIEDHLRSNYTYSLAGDQDPDDPLHDFLFGKRHGHCEYFATAMVVLLRSVGVPARMANGFHGGAWNAFGRYWEIRQGDAHAWAEAYFPGVGWLTFEPTPPGGATWPADEGFLAAIGHWFDSLKLQWYKWIVEYDLEKQVEVFRAIGRQLAALGAGLFPGLGGGDEDSQGVGLRAALKDIVNARTGAGLGLLLGGSLLAWFVVWLLRRPRSRGGRRDVARARRAYLRLLALARRSGVEVGASTTPDEVVARLREQEHPGAEAAGVVVDAYQAVRYGGGPWDAAARGRAAVALREVARAQR